jgi:DNA polymerase-3 subunit beta
VGWTTPANSISLDAYRFKPAVKRTAWAADEESTRYALGGVFMVFEPGRLTLAATDSRCLAVESVEIEEQDVSWSGIVPTYAIAAAAPLMGGTFQFRYGDKSVEFVGTDSSYYSRLVEGRFPKYQDVLPKGKFPCEIVFGRDDLLQLVNQSLMVTAVETRGVDFEIMDRVLVASCGSEEKGKFAGRLAVAFDGRIGVTLDPSFLREFLTRLEPDCKVLWGIGGSDKANRFTVEGLNWQAVVMPLARE